MSFVPFMNLSLILMKKFQFEFLTIWPKNDVLRLATCFNWSAFSFALPNTSFFVILFT